VARLIVATFVWGAKYGPEYVERLKRAVQRNVGLNSGIYFTAFDMTGDPLTEIPGCFARLRLFDPKWYRERGLRKGDRVLVLDLDLIVTACLEPLFEDDAPFRILQGVNSSNPCKFNGSVWRLDLGYRPDVWTTFSGEAAAALPYDSFPDDQQWLFHMMPDAAAFGPESGVFAFQKPGWPKGEALPLNARIVAFPGWRDPSKFTHLPWVRQHWLREKAAA
jgi:hypothetical protein